MNIFEALRESQEKQRDLSEKLIIKNLIKQRDEAKKEKILINNEK